MNRAVLQRRLAEAEEQIASGLRHIARQREVIAAHFGDCERRFHAMVSAHFI
jgi:hypothetical protein